MGLFPPFFVPLILFLLGSEQTTSQKHNLACIVWIKMSISSIQLNDDWPVILTSELVPESAIVAFGDPVTILRIIRN